jgi:D-alanyl-D-alanine carboxypeptidase/D-alanyl-D-alanine-endopeptidase (penicillin-binding protein 4)
VRPSLHRGLVVLSIAATSIGGSAALAQSSSAATLAQTQASLKKIVRGMPSGTGVYIHEAATNTTLASRSPSTKRVPASVTKLFTASTALMLDGPATTLKTGVYLRGTIDDDGTLDGDLIVRGAGDPALRLDQIAQLADAIKKRGIKKLDGTLRADLNGWTADQGTPLTNGAYNREIGGRVGALVTLRGFASAAVTDPSRQVLVRLRDAMRARGLSGTVKFGAPMAIGNGATFIADVESPTIQQLVASTLAPSDNFYAEMLLRGVGARHGSSGTTPAGLAAERTALGTIGVYPTLYDGSGLSHSNRVAPTTVVKLLDKMATRTEGPALRTGMALAGATGTVAGRMRGTAAAGRCRVKTGTLSNVSALAGYCTTLGKRTVTFAVIMNHTAVAAARAAQDRAAVAIANWTDAPDPDAPSPTTPAKTTPTPTSPAPGGIPG